MNHTSRNLALLLFNLRKGEEEALPSNAFTGRIAKGYRYGLLAASVVGIGMGFFLLVVIRDSVSGTMFGMLGIAATLMLPTYFSYRLYVDKTVIRETYCILCFRKSKEVFW